MGSFLNQKIVIKKNTENQIMIRGTFSEVLRANKRTNYMQVIIMGYKLT